MAFTQGTLAFYKQRLYFYNNLPFDKIQLFIVIKGIAAGGFGILFDN